jgi:hypothetical protein
LPETRIPRRQETPIPQIHTIRIRDDSRNGVTRTRSLLFARAVAGPAAAFASTGAGSLQTQQNDKDGDGNHTCFSADDIESRQQNDDTNQGDEHAGHFVAQAAASFGFTTLFFFCRFHG